MTYQHIASRQNNNQFCRRYIQINFHWGFFLFEFKVWWMLFLMVLTDDKPLVKIMVPRRTSNRQCNHLNWRWPVTLTQRCLSRSVWLNFICIFGTGVIVSWHNIPAWYIISIDIRSQQSTTNSDRGHLLYITPLGLHGRYCQTTLEKLLISENAVGTGIKRKPKFT